MTLLKKLKLREPLARSIFLFSLFGLLFLLYTLTRFLFYFYNINFFRDLTSHEVFLSFFLGLRFDFSALAYVNAFFVFIAALPAFIFYQRHTQVFLKFVFTVLNASFFALAMADILFFPFQHKHIDRAALFLFAASGQQLALVLEFWWCLPILFLLGYALYQSYTGFFRFFLVRDFPHPHSSIQTVFFCFVIFLCFTAARGGFQSRVLDTVNASVMGNYKTSLLLLNAPFTLIKSWDKSLLKERHYFKNDDELRKYLASIRQCQEAQDFPKTPRNVVLIIMESLGAEFLSLWKGSSKRYTPFFDRLIAEGGALFSNMYANEGRTTQSMSAILGSLPNWSTSAISRTPYINNDYPTLGAILKKRAYRTLFMQGGRGRSMYIGATVRALSIDEQYNYDDFEKYAKAKGIPRERWDDRDKDGWGVYDDQFFLYAAETLIKLPQKPFFAVLLSNSAHGPFLIPEEFAGKFPKGETPFYESQAYADYSLGLFFDKIKKESWAKETLFVITADHPPETSYPWSKNFLSRRRIPLLFYQPERPLTFMRTEYLAQQLDILPTILDFLNIKDEKMLPFAHSLLAHCKEKHIVLFDDPNYWILSSQEALFVSEDFQILTLFKFQPILGTKYPPMNLKEVKEREKQKQKLQKRLQAYIQYYNNGLIYNKLFLF